MVLHVQCILKHMYTFQLPATAVRHENNTIISIMYTFGHLHYFTGKNYFQYHQNLLTLCMAYLTVVSFPDLCRKGGEAEVWKRDQLDSSNMDSNYYLVITSSCSHLPFRRPYFTSSWSQFTTRVLPGLHTTLSWSTSTRITPVSPSTMR